VILVWPMLYKGWQLCNRLINESHSVSILSKLVHRILELKRGKTKEGDDAWFLFVQYCVSVNSCVTDWLMSLSNYTANIVKALTSVTNWLMSLSWNESCPNLYTELLKTKFVKRGNNAWFLFTRCCVSLDKCNRLNNESLSNYSPELCKHWQV